MPARSVPRNRRTETIQRSAIIVSHGQPSDPLPAEADLAALCASVAAHMPDWQVVSATLANPGALETALGSVTCKPLIYPLFMTDGWFVRSALPKRIGDVPAQILPPLGAEARLPDLVADYLDTALREKRWIARETKLLVASHGSGRSPRSKLATESFATALARKTEFAGSHIGYVEEAPYFADVARECRGQALCLPFFAAYGGHVKEDITEALSEAKFQGVLLDPVGTIKTVPEFISRSLERAADEVACG